MSDMDVGEHEATLNGIRIHYAVRGSGPPLIAISGGPGMDARVWDDFAGIDAFLTVIAMHPRGSGLSEDAPDNAYSLADYAGDVEALRRHLGLSRPVVMGWSHGGMVAQQFAITHPESLSRLILVDTSAYFGDFVSDVDAAVEAFRDRPWFERAHEALKREWAGDYETDDDMTELWSEEIRFYFKDFNERAEAYRLRTRALPVRVTPLKVFNEGEAETMDLRPRLGRVRVPTLVIVGRHDFITTVPMAEEMARHLPISELAVFEDSGHFPMVEEAEKFRRTIKAFVEDGT